MWTRRNGAPGVQAELSRGFARLSDRIKAIEATRPEAMKEPLWYAVNVDVNDKYIMTNEHDKLGEALDDADSLVADLAPDMDIASWRVMVLPHWCDKNDDCYCDLHHEDKPYGERKSETFDF